MTNRRIVWRSNSARYAQAHPPQPGHVCRDRRGVPGVRAAGGAADGAAARGAADAAVDRRTNAIGPIQSVTKYQLLLSNYFPTDHWSQTRPPKVIASSNEQAMLVLDDYERHDDGRVDIERISRC